MELEFKKQQTNTPKVKKINWENYVDIRENTKKKTRFKPT